MPSNHYSDAIMSAIVSQITSFSIVYSDICSGADQRKYQSSESLAFVRGIHQWPVISLHKGPVTRKMFPFDDVIMHHAWSVNIEGSQGVILRRLTKVILTFYSPAQRSIHWSKIFCLSSCGVNPITTLMGAILLRLQSNLVEMYLG